MSPAEEILSRLEHFGVRLGLERINALLAAMGNPHLATPSILIAGTNGKGSVSSLLACMLQAAGYRTGLFTSPHLETIYERIRLDGRLITDSRLATELRHILGLAKAHGCEPPTYFESFTLSAIRYFLSASTDLAVFEVGLGGRLDATNVNQPIVSAISSIGFDHMKQLGQTLGAIAGEKAGIFRHGRPAIAWAEQPEVEEALVERARALSTPLTLAHRVTQFSSRGLMPQEVWLKTPSGSLDLRLFLAGPHQLRNLAVAVLAAECLREQGWDRLTPEAIVEGVATCRWPGRLELVDLPNGQRVLLDAAHNTQGIAALSEYLALLGQPFDLLFGVLEKKKVGEMLPPLACKAERITLTRPTGGRGSDPGQFVGLLEEAATTVVEDPGEALDHALGQSADRLLVISGSLHLIGDIRGALRQRFGLPPRIR